MNDNSGLDLRVYEERMATEFRRQRPSVLFRPSLALDGNKYFVLYGPNIMEGCAGFGDSPEEAMDDFDRNWSAKPFLKTGAQS
jgi:hypothetical protein